MKVNAKFLKTVNLAMHDILGQTEGRDAVNEHAAGFMKSLIDIHLDSLGSAVSGAGKGGRARADAGHTFSRHRGGTCVMPGLGLACGRGAVVIRNVALEPPDGHGLPLGLQDAFALALLLLGAHASADRGKRVGRLDQTVSLGDIALTQGADEIADGNAHRAACHAARFLALQASAGLGHGRCLIIAQGNLLKIMPAFLGRLARHRSARAHTLLFLSFHYGCSCILPWTAVPGRDKRKAGGAVRRNRPDGHQTQDRQHRQNGFCRRQSHDRHHTCRCRQP